MTKLGVNIDHVATLRNARGEKYPDILRAAQCAIKAGADNITVHLREDRRHIKDYDLQRLKNCLQDIPINLEVGLQEEMVNIAVQVNPYSVCIVPEKRQEITTEGGLDTTIKTHYLKETIKKFREKGIKTSLFVEPNLETIQHCHELNADCIEIHTGRYAYLYNQNDCELKDKALQDIQQAAFYAQKYNMDIHAGHGLTYDNVQDIASINAISCLNIGHFLISEAVFIGLSHAITKMKQCIKNTNACS